MLKAVTLLFLSGLSAAALPLGSISGHCGSVFFALDVTISNLTNDRASCPDDLAAQWSLEGLPLLAEGVALKQVGIFGEPGNVELTIRADILWNLVVDGSGYFATCFGTGITTLGNGSGTLSHSFGPWSIGTPCDFSHAIAITDGEPIPLISRTYLHALGGAVVDLGLEEMNFWNSTGQPINGYSFSLQPIRGLAPVPEPPTSLQLLLTLFPAAVLCVARHLSGTSNVEDAGLIQSTVKPGGLDMVAPYQNWK